LAELEGASTSLLDQYTDSAGWYAFTTYDQSLIHDGPLRPADVLMANLLSLRLDWRDVTPLFTTTETQHTALLRALNEALVEARALPPLEDLDDAAIQMPALRAANETAYSVPYSPMRKRRTWTSVTVSKVLHRLAPTVPIFDSHVREFYAANYAGEFRWRLRNDLNDNREWLMPLARTHRVRGHPAPLDRIADIIIWMDRITKKRKSN
jgi:hypothetical protein